LVDVTASDGLAVRMLDPTLQSPTYDAALCAALEAAGHDVVLHCRTTRPDESDPGESCRVERSFYRRAERLRASGGVAQRLSDPVKVGEHAVDLTRLVRRWRADAPDVVHIQWLVVPLIDGAAIAALRRVTTVVLTLHNSKPLHGTPRSRLQTAGWERVLRLADHLIVHTEEARDVLTARGHDADTVSVAPLGLLPSQPSGGGERDDGVVELLLFGGLRPYKGVDVLLDAVAGMRADLRSRVRIRVAGVARMPVEELRARAAQLGIGDAVTWDLRFVPEREMGAMLDGTDVLVYPYREIDASAALVQGLAHAKPIVASAVGSFAEVLVDGESALLVPPSDPAALARALDRVVGDATLRANLAVGAQRLAERFVSWDDVAELTASAYERGQRRRTSRA
jgi:glycosyltransferase involved in cell wall biosynthesis